MGVVDEPLPAHRGPWFLEVDAHDHEDIAGDLVREGLQALAILEREFGVVDRAGTDHCEQTRVLAIEDILHGLA